ncbi:hypothetical protein IID04_01105 [PVC group bacterium]|nr:hypothetical protein [PVC group bacterium]
MILSRKTFSLARITSLEIIRLNLFWVLAAFSGIIVIFTKTFSVYSTNIQINMVQDIGLVLIAGVNTFLVVILVAWILPREVENKTIYGFFTQSVRKVDYVAGKFFGFAFILFLMTFFLSFLLFVYVWLSFDVRAYHIFTVALFSYIANVILLSITILSSTVLTGSVNIFFGLFVYMMGSFNQSLEYLVERSMEIPLLKAGLITVLKIIPDFDRLNIRDEVLAGIPIHWEELWSYSMGSLLLYGGVCLITAGIVFSRREF